MIAIVAGTGALPIEACKNLFNTNQTFFVVCLFPEDNFLAIKSFVGERVEVIQQDFYKASQILNLLKQKQTTKLIFVGKVDKNNLLKNFKLDWMAVKLLASIFYKSDAAIMERLISELESHGIEVLSQASILESLFVPPGVLTGKLSTALERDIQMGIGTALKMSEFDIGQTVVVKDQMVLAIEAIEGTDKCIQRGIDLGKSDVVVCKAAWAKQNKKFDLPALGPDSLKSIQGGQVSAIAWISDKTLIVRQEEFIKMAKDRGITLVSCK